MFFLFLSKIMNVIAGSALTFMMLFAFSDVVLRALGMPIIGTYEIVSLVLAIVIGFGLPQVSFDKGHVYMEFLVEKLPNIGKRIMYIFTRCLAFILFIFAGYNLLSMTASLKRASEVSATMKIPIYPFAFMVAICCFIQAATLIVEILRVLKGDYE